MRHNKIYSIEKSPLYGLKNKKKLSGLLGIDHLHLEMLTSDDNYYIQKKIRGSKERETQTPFGELDIAHKKIFKFLSRIETPEYLFSGKKGLSYVNNASFHKDNDYFVIMDIEKFYPNSRGEYIFRFFRYTMNMSEDISFLLRDMICYKNYIPTGSSLSQIIAYWAYKDVFNEIYNIAISHGYTFSLYVDDMTFSSKQRIKTDFHLEINACLQRVGLKIKRNKLKYYSKNHYKLITGCIVTPDHLLKVPNYIRKNIVKKLKGLASVNLLSENQFSSLMGSIISAQQIEKEIFMDSRRYLKKYDFK